MVAGQPVHQYQDGASSSHMYQQQHHHQQQYLSAQQQPYQTYVMHSPDSVMGEEEEDLESEVAEPGAALQYWTASRHKSSGKGKDKADEEYCEDTINRSSPASLLTGSVPWRLRTRSKVSNGGMFICLNIGVDPPDIVKTNPCAKLETWIDPTALPPTKAIEAIGKGKHFPACVHVRPRRG